MDTHHNVGFGTDATKCSWCHDFSLPFNVQIRVCENCHGRDSLHNIQLDSDNDSIIEPGVEAPGFGHIGDPDDCWGCHGYSLPSSAATFMSASAANGPVVPYINTVNPTILFTGTNTLITVTGTAFTNKSKGTLLFSNIAITAENGTESVFIPDTITESTIEVTIPSAFLPGSYTLRALKVDKYSNPKVLTIKPSVIITDASIRQSCGSCTGELTINGSGFGPSPPPGTESFYHVKQDGVILPSTTWTDTLIKSTGAACDGKSITITGFYGSATYPLP
jgi:hypothetical protein